MSQTKPTVLIIDDDASVRESLCFLMRSVGLDFEAFASAKDFLQTYDPVKAGCLVLDVRMPGMSGIELQERLAAMGCTLPVIFLTAHGDVPMAVEALKAGATDFLQKPFRDQELVDKVHHAIAEDARIRRKCADRQRIESRIGSLTPREREVMEMVVEGKANKVIAMELDLSQRTVEIHRSRVMTKMGADSLPELVRMVVQIRK
jgi:FixJ family two-component response regulator